MLLYLAKYTTYECLVWAIIDFADTATHIPSFRTPAYPVTGRKSGQILDSFSIIIFNRFTYLSETRALGLFEQALAINGAIFAVCSTQAWIFELFSDLERSIWKNSLLRSAVLAHDDANSGASRSGKARRSFTELYMLHTSGEAD